MLEFILSVSDMDDYLITVVRDANKLPVSSPEPVQDNPKYGYVFATFRLTDLYITTQATLSG